MTTILTAALGAAMMMAAPAPQTVSFSFDRELLMTDGGVAKVHQRMARRAIRLCRDGRPTAAGVRLARSCASSLLDEWVVGADSYRLTAYHQGGSPGFAARD